MDNLQEPAAPKAGATFEPADEDSQKLGKDSNRSAYIIGAAVLAGAILICAGVFYNGRLILKKLDNLNQANQQAAVVQVNNQQAAAPAAPAGPVDINLKSNTQFLGNADAKVTVVEFADYQCPYCEKWYSDIMPQLKSQYINTNKIKFVYQDLAILGPDSSAAAEATHCAADQNRFWQYHDYLFSHQGQENGGWAGATNLKKFAKALGMNTAQFNQCLDSGKYKQEVLDETAAGKSYGVSGTPSTFVNGQIVVGAQPFSVFQQAIDAALK
jgi:protein-disulfide isomerase